VFLGPVLVHFVQQTIEVEGEIDQERFAVALAGAANAEDFDVCLSISHRVEQSQGGHAATPSLR
jgi:hypothetical protein